MYPIVIYVQKGLQSRVAKGKIVLIMIFLKLNSVQGQSQGAEDSRGAAWQQRVFVCTAHDTRRCTVMADNTLKILKVHKTTFV